MKLSLIAIMLSILLILKGQDTTAEQYSINQFLNYLQENLYWEILDQTTIYFGAEVSIELCKEFVPSPHCEEVVRVYILKSYSRAPPEGEQNLLNINKLDNFLDEQNYSTFLRSKCKPLSKYDEKISKIKMRFN